MICGGDWARCKLGRHGFLRLESAQIKSISRAVPAMTSASDQIRDRDYVAGHGRLRLAPMRAKSGSLKLRLSDQRAALYLRRIEFHRIANHQSRITPLTYV